MIDAINCFCLRATVINGSGSYDYFNKGGCAG